MKVYLVRIQKLKHANKKDLFQRRSGSKSLPASPRIAFKNPDSFIKTSSYKLLTSRRVIQVKHSRHVVHVHVDWLVKPTDVIRVQIRILIGCGKDESLEWVPGHCVAAHRHDNLAQWSGTAHVIQDNATIGRCAGKEMGLGTK